MIWSFLRKHGVIFLVLIVAILAYWRLHPRAPKYISAGYIAERNVTLWNTLAQVKQPIEELHYGDRVDIVREEGTAAQIHTDNGTIGWLLDSREIMDAELWAQSANLLAQARTLPIQARGQTKTVSNVRIEPGRNGKRIFQLMRGTPVVVLQRTVADDSQPSDEARPEQKNPATGSAKPKREDWLLIMRSEDQRGVQENKVSDAEASSTGATASEAPAQPVAPSSGDPVSSGPIDMQSNSTADDAAARLPGTPIAGWVLARFIELTLPDAVKDYASSADLRVVAWFELNRVPDGAGKQVPQYLVAGSRGSEGQPCDFTMIRVYTWGAVRKRYETAFVESGLCGHLPIRVSQDATGPEFRFSEVGENSVERTYRMNQTVVRRVKDGSENKIPRRRAKP